MKATNPLFERILDLISNESTIVVGLSGGPDSVFLLHYLASLRQEKNLKLIAAHLDHGWRAESAQDAQFCQQLTGTYKVPLITKNLKDLEPSFRSNGSKEELGRKARRAFFGQVAKEHDAHTIALAHHANDQMETFFLRLIRGASLTGLAAIKPQEGLYIRPLLQISKQEILDYLQSHQIPYVIDASNQSDDYLRNRIRNSVIPALKNCDNRFEKNFAATHAKLVETEEFLQQFCSKGLKEMSDENNSLDVQKLLALHPVICNRILIKWLIMHHVPFTPSQGLLDEIRRFLENSKNNTHLLHQKWCLIKKNRKLSITLI